LRFFFGAGCRIYFAEDGDTVVLLLCGGDKGSQSKDISKAQSYWKDYQATTAKAKEDKKESEEDKR
jgi:putative addiction module killer protein